MFLKPSTYKKIFKSLLLLPLLEYILKTIVYNNRLKTIAFIGCSKNKKKNNAIPILIASNYFKNV